MYIVVIRVFDYNGICYALLDFGSRSTYIMWLNMAQTLLRIKMKKKKQFVLSQLSTHAIHAAILSH